MIYYVKFKSTGRFHKIFVALSENLILIRSEKNIGAYLIFSAFVTFLHQVQNKCFSYLHNVSMLSAGIPQKMISNMSIWLGDCKNMKEKWFPRWLFEGRPRQIQKLHPDGLDLLSYLAGNSRAIVRFQFLFAIPLSSRHEKCCQILKIPFLWKMIWHILISFITY